MFARLRLPPILSLTICLFTLDAANASQPNILWITAEDMSPVLGCYGDDFAITPNIDQLATESVRYLNAFATAPVCSPVRSCLITGVYAPSLGTHNMRSAFAIPEHIRGFPAYLRDAGYYTSNNVKTDYNTSSWKRLIAESWHESSNTAHWRKRSDKQKGRPFFSVFNLMTSHQSRSMVWTHERFQKEVQSRLAPHEIHDPAQVILPPYYPDTPFIRRTVARFYDCVTAMDHEVGAILRQLEEDGLADDTIVFFYSDHGSGMPRHKRALLDSGMHVPLLIRFPEKYRHLAPVPAGKTTDHLVSFIDFPPTVLTLAGVDVPAHMQGQPFLGAKKHKPREYAFGHRDRVDEAIDVARSVRDKQYLYIRNYMPHLSYNQPTAWPDLGQIRHEFYRLTDRNKMTAAQWHFAGPTRPREELYDCRTDPQNLRNLADSPEHLDVLTQRRIALRQHLSATRDLGFLPEVAASKLFKDVAPWTAARDPDFEQQTRRVTSRYWQAIAAAGVKSIDAEGVAELKDMLKEESLAVRIAAADALARHDQVQLALPVLLKFLEHEDLTVVLHAARTIELTGQDAGAAIPAMRKLLERAERLRPSNTPATFVQSGDQDLAMFASFAAQGFLNRVDNSGQAKD